jgi:hypothetical protein
MAGMKKEEPQTSQSHDLDEHNSGQFTYQALISQTHSSSPVIA